MTQNELYKDYPVYVQVNFAGASFSIFQKDHFVTVKLVMAAVA